MANLKILIKISKKCGRFLPTNYRLRGRNIPTSTEKAMGSVTFQAKFKSGEIHTLH